MNNYLELVGWMLFYIGFGYAFGWSNGYRKGHKDGYQRGKAIARHISNQTLNVSKFKVINPTYTGRAE